ncbi:hypothetical protein GCM10012280_50330 [Wenjunlia tyrosinilytica]|uniref:Protein kinase domain-containing protein n=1 Tax=Wenjunlia tyrosinilytica TaxID=1544741 RepID=A0A917ZTP7_9ACTN|nr:hypothetical protein GCM10012280_50330 [Wenjunlia tyrosinilytica]
MRVVYLARSASGEKAAVKVVRREWTEDPQFRARFELEVAAARMVHSAFNAPVIDADPYAPRPWTATLSSPAGPWTSRCAKAARSPRSSCRTWPRHWPRH